MGVPMLDLKRQFRSIEADVYGSLNAVIEQQSFILGEAVEAFESDLASYLGVEHAIGVASGTDALLLTLKALDLRPSDEVIAPAFTFFATAGAIHNAGGKPVFVDIDPLSFNIAPDAVEEAITERTRAIIPVHLFGQMADMHELSRIAQEKELFLLEDAAQAIGASQFVGEQWRGIGAIGDAAALSFFPSKNLGGFGDGGLIATNDPDLADRVRRLRVHGGRKMYHHQDVGTNSRLDALQAAVLQAKLPHLDTWNEARRSHAEWYYERLSGLEDKGFLRRPRIASENKSVFNQYTLRVQDRDELRDFLTDRDIGSAVYYPVPLHLQTCFSHLGYRSGDLQASEQAANEVLSIPVFPELSVNEQETVAASIEEFYDG